MIFTEAELYGGMIISYSNEVKPSGIVVKNIKEMINNIKSPNQLMATFKLNKIDWHRSQRYHHVIYYNYDYFDPTTVIQTRIGDCFEQSCTVFKTLCDREIKIIDDFYIGGIYSKTFKNVRLPGHYFPIIVSGRKYSAFVYFGGNQGFFKESYRLEEIFDFMNRIYIPAMKKEPLYKLAAGYSNFCLM